MLDTHLPQSNPLVGLLRRSRAVADAKLVLAPNAAKLSFRGREKAVAIAAAAFGVELPQVACRFIRADNRSAFWLGPDEWLLQAVGESPVKVFAELEGRLGGQSCSLVDVSHRSCAFSIVGAKSEYILNHGCPLDLSLAAFPVGMCTRTVIGDAAVMLSRPEEASFDIDVWRSFAPYVWQLLDEARRELA